MQRNSMLSALCVSVALLFASGCAPDAETISGPDPQFDQTGLGKRLAIFKFVDEFEFVIPAHPRRGCKGFAVGVAVRNKVTVQVFQTHLVIHNEFKSTLTNLATGFFLDDNGAWKDVLHFDEMGDLENVTTIGSIFRITVPGHGIVVQDTGIITFDPATGEVLFEGGPHEQFHGTAPGLCEALTDFG